MANIFVIDDEPILLNLIFNVLQLERHNVTPHSNPLLALEAIISAQPPVDLLITDAEMRPITGFQLVTRLRENLIGCPVIFMSGYHGVVAAVAESMGHRAVLEKPFTAVELRAAVQKSLTAGKTKPHRAA